ncbi:MAG TPA: ATP-dependent DNA ligase [Candidatus Nitrosopolaris sp.]|nr:ATP-dependent DNA ligase [Candidatus Nitrosopolaris sp.]
MDFSIIVDTFEQMELTSSRLTLADYLVSLLRQTPTDIIDRVIYLIQGRLHPDYEGVELGLAEKMAIRAISLSTGLHAEAIAQIYRKTGDLGVTTGEAMKSKNQTTLFAEKMTVERVYSTLDKIAHSGGTGSQDAKLRLVSGLLSDATSRESRFIMKLMMGTLRLGIADYTVIDALALAFTGDKSTRQILENAYNVSSDLGTVAKLLATKGLESLRLLEITLFKPVRPMLAERVKSAKEAIERMKGQSMAAEYKLDGERIQVHKGKDKVELFSRRLEKITHHYPDITEAIKKSIKTNEMILEAEVTAINAQTEEFLPFQELMHRRRKYGIKEAIEEYPVVINVFDVLYIDGKDKTSLPYIQRRKLIEKITKGLMDEKVKLVPQVIVRKTQDLEQLMAIAIEHGCEGLMIKQLASSYRAGARGFTWIKLKREYRTDLADTLDLVIVAALYGRGRRVGKYGALLLAAYDPEADTFRSTCKVGTGFTDLDLEHFYKSLEDTSITHRHPRVDTRMQMDLWFEPRIVIEVSASEITLSPSHTAGINSIRENYGLGLRFPKFTGKIRADKDPEDATNVKELISMYKRQMRSIKNTKVFSKS